MRRKASQESNRSYGCIMQALQRLTERHLKAQFDSTWYVTTIKEASEQL